MVGMTPRSFFRRLTVRHIRPRTAAEVHEFLRGAAKHGVRRARGRPQNLMPVEVPIDQYPQRLRRADRRDSADGKACQALYGIGVRSSKRTAQERCQLF